MVAWVGRIRDPALGGLARAYLDQAARLGPVELKELKASRAAPRERRQAEDFAALFDPSRAPATVVLTERGKGLDSRGFAALLAERIHRRADPTWFLLGGEEGFRPPDEARAGLRLRLSELTLPHELARVVFLEQIYRALTILRNMKYHR